MTLFTWNFREWKGVYLAGVGVIGVLVLIHYGNKWKIEKEKERSEIVKTWPITEARVEKSSIVFFDTTGKGGVNGTYHAELTVSYRFNDDAFQRDIRTHWGMREDIGKDGKLEVGEKIPLRIHPEDPSKVSLIEITGRP